MVKFGFKNLGIVNKVAIYNKLLNKLRELKSRYIGYAINYDNEPAELYIIYVYSIGPEEYTNHIKGVIDTIKELKVYKNKKEEENDDEEEKMKKYLTAYMAERRIYEKIVNKELGNVMYKCMKMIYNENQIQESKKDRVDIDDSSSNEATYIVKFTFKDVKDVKDVKDIKDINKLYETLKEKLLEIKIDSICYVINFNEGNNFITFSYLFTNDCTLEQYNHYTTQVFEIINSIDF